MPKGGGLCRPKARRAGSGSVTHGVAWHARHTPRRCANRAAADFGNSRTHNVRSAVTSMEPSASASHVLGHCRRNAAVKLSRTRLLRWGAVSAASTSSKRLS
jgi:hypothetical protein